MKYIEKVNRNFIIIIVFILICLSLFYFLLPSKILIKHELLNDTKLKLGESNYEISNRYELLYESEYAYNNYVLNDKILNHYEKIFNCNIKSDKSFYFFSGGIIRLFQILNKFELLLIVEAEVSNFKNLTNYLLEKAVNDYGKYYKTKFETNSSEFIWKFDNYYFIIGIYHKGYAHYDLDKQSIYLTWTKVLQ